MLTREAVHPDTFTNLASDYPAAIEFEDDIRKAIVNVLENHIGPGYIEMPTFDIEEVAAVLVSNVIETFAGLDATQYTTPGPNRLRRPLDATAHIEDLADY